MLGGGLPLQRPLSHAVRARQLWRVLPSDTHPKVAALLVEGYRRMSKADVFVLEREPWMRRARAEAAR